MSYQDFMRYSKDARSFILRNLAAKFATNSIKLYRRGSSGRGVPYIWIDPPWKIWHKNKPFLASWSYPNPHRPSGRFAEEKWLNTARTFYGGRLLSIRRTVGGKVVFRFAEGWELRCDGKKKEVDSEYWYDDWYASLSHTSRD